MLCLSYFMAVLYQCLMFVCLLQYFYRSISLAFYYFFEIAELKTVYLKKIMLHHKKFFISPFRHF